MTLPIVRLPNSHGRSCDEQFAANRCREAAPVEDLHFHPVEPRTLRATVTVSF
jgi:hypothetical protein